MGRLLRVKIIDAWRGYNPNSIVTMTEKAYYENKKSGVNLSIVSGHVSTSPEDGRNTVEKERDVEDLHDFPVKFTDEEE